MNFAYSVRVRLGILLIAFFSLLSSYQLLVQPMQFDLRLIGRDEITLNEKRFDKIKESLPSHGVVGYRPNGLPTTVEQLTFGNPGDLQQWFFTQYALAPVIVSPTEGHSRVICIYAAEAGVYLPGDNPIIREYGAGWKILDFGKGVRLIKPELE
jgi:hypothetical protein